MSLTKATITNLENRKVITCLFNPTEYTVAKQNQWTPRESVGTNVPKLDFTGGGSRTMTLELFFDVFEQQGASAADLIGKLWDLTMIDKNSATTKNKKSGKARPPLCLFQWGGTWQFTAAVTNLSVKYTLFRPDGTPVRAIASITLQEAQDDKKQKGTNPTSYAEPGHRVRTVKPQDTLPLIAYQEYGDAGKWRHIASANNLDDPQSISAGQILKIPERV